MRRERLFFLYIVIGIGIFGSFNYARAASLFTTPTNGTFTVGETFTVSLFVDTKGEEINAFEAFIYFPSDKVQVVSSGIGTSITDAWITLPKFDNQKGIIELRGGIPGGITTSGGRIATFLFRSKKTGSVLIRTTENSRVFKNDGQGTNILLDTQGGLYTITLPPPEGPRVVSETHSDESRWYKEQNVVLRWSTEGYDQFSFLLNDLPVDAPDSISEGNRGFVSYKDLKSGTYYFHIKGLNDGLWGGVSHFAINIDTESPAEFPILVNPLARTTQRRPIIEFATTDQFSGMSRYELKIIPLGPGIEGINAHDEPFFIEVESPYILPELDLGNYDIILRAYDEAGNYREVTKQLSIKNFLFLPIEGKGIQLRSRIIIPWWVIFLAGTGLVSALLFGVWHAKRWHIHFHKEHNKPTLSAEMQRRLAELETYRRKYGHLVLLFAIFGMAMALTLGIHSSVFAQEFVDLSPPVVTVVSRNISNEDIFYIGGDAHIPDARVTVFLQNPRTGETTSYVTTSDKKGEWFYRHHSFLEAGEYILWTQSSVGDIKSPPSPQEKIVVQATAFQLGSSRLSYEVVYLFIILLLVLACSIALSFIFYHGYYARRKQKIAREKLRNLEESVKRGFAVLKRDVERELAHLKKKKGNGSAVAPHEEEYEKQLLDDLQSIGAYLGKEIWEIEGTVSGHSPRNSE